MGAVYLADRLSHVAEQLVAVGGDRVADGALEALAVVLVLPAQDSVLLFHAAMVLPLAIGEVIVGIAVLGAFGAEVSASHGGLD